ncbi:MAG: hypothetical protein ACR2PL_07580 [Dehalococcoidia bacterium]
MTGEHKEALEQQTATSEILRVISGSRADEQRVLDSVCESAPRVCGGDSGQIVLLEGAVIRVVAEINVSPQARSKGVTFPLSRGRVTGRSILDRFMVHIWGGQAATRREFPSSAAILD